MPINTFHLAAAAGLRAFQIWLMWFLWEIVVGWLGLGLAVCHLRPAGKSLAIISKRRRKTYIFLTLTGGYYTFCWFKGCEAHNLWIIIDIILFSKFSVQFSMNIFVCFFAKSLYLKVGIDEKRRSHINIAWCFHLYQW